MTCRLPSWADLSCPESLLSFSPLYSCPKRSHSSWAPQRPQRPQRPQKTQRSPRPMPSPSRALSSIPLVSSTSAHHTYWAPLCDPRVHLPGKYCLPHQEVSPYCPSVPLSLCLPLHDPLLTLSGSSCTLGSTSPGPPVTSSAPRPSAPTRLRSTPAAPWP